MELPPLEPYPASSWETNSMKDEKIDREIKDIKESIELVLTQFDKTMSHLSNLQADQQRLRLDLDNIMSLVQTHLTKFGPTSSGELDELVRGMSEEIEGIIDKMRAQVQAVEAGEQRETEECQQ